MNKLSQILKNNWTLKTTLVIVIAYIAYSFLFDDGFRISELIISFMITLYFIWGYSSEIKNSLKKK
tara:strand:+ start:6658 stop:6855 length:198 start_codon:yes stop_codon:yes gene_type:complete